MRKNCQTSTCLTLEEANIATISSLIFENVVVFWLFKKQSVCETIAEQFTSSLRLILMQNVFCQGFENTGFT